MLCFVAPTPRGSHVLLAHATTLATVPPSVHHSAALGQPAQSVQEGHAEAVKKESAIKIAQETPHTKAGNSRENTSHAGSGVAARWGGTSPWATAPGCQFAFWPSHCRLPKLWTFPQRHHTFPNGVTRWSQQPFNVCSEQRGKQASPCASYQGWAVEVEGEGDDTKSLMEKSWEGERKEMQSLVQFVLLHFLRNKCICWNSESALNREQVSSLNVLSNSTSWCPGETL